ncbi:DUF4345 family protein [Pseudoalteromonas luteoviolacea]|nr:DUF4345 family protein [Pseudoalteromonas luteoviolacea]
MSKNIIGRLMVGLLAIFFMGTGLIFMFSPLSMLTHIFIDPIESAAGLSSIRALWGGTTIAIWLMVLIGAIKNKIDYIWVGLVSLLLVLIGRLVGFLNDGGYAELLFMCIPTVVATCILLVAFKLMKPIY